MQLIVVVDMLWYKCVVLMCACLLFVANSYCSARRAVRVVLSFAILVVSIHQQYAQEQCRAALYRLFMLT
jgi:hypothetical protein